MDQEDYYRRIFQLNLAHYAGEVPYYVQARLRKVEARLLTTLPGGSVLLDIGCGSGRFSVGAAELGFKVIGIDITPHAVEAAKKRAADCGLSNAAFVIADMSALPFADGTFPYVICPRFSINAVATQSRRSRSVREMVRVAKNGGSIFIESLNKLYLGVGLLPVLKHLTRDLGRTMRIIGSRLFRHPYRGLLPGDIVYQSNKVANAPEGYAHLATARELRKLIPEAVNFRFHSIPELLNPKRVDIFRFNRYSLWVLLTKFKDG